MRTEIQYFVESTGRKMAILSAEFLSELLEMREDAEAIKAYDQVKSNPGEIFPHSFVTALADTDSPLREWRKYRNLSQTQLANKVGVAQPVISSLENAKARHPNLALARKLARALDADVDDLFEL